MSCRLGSSHDGRRESAQLKAQLGHARASITLDVYTHLFDRVRHATTFVRGSDRRRSQRPSRKADAICVPRGDGRDAC